MAMRTKVIGPISAYAIAVANGYTGTEAEFAEQIANAATNAQTAQTAADHCDDVLASIPQDYSALSGEVDNLKSEIKYNLILKTASITFDQGGLSSNTASTFSSDTRIRSHDFLPSDIIGAKVPEGKQIWAYAFTDGTYQGRYVGNRTISKSTAAGVSSTPLYDFLFADLVDGKYDWKIVVLNTNDSDIVPADASGLKYYYATDSTLSVSGKPADALATHNAINDVDLVVSGAKTQVTEIVNPSMSRAQFVTACDAQWTNYSNLCLCNGKAFWTLNGASTFEEAYLRLNANFRDDVYVPGMTTQTICDRINHAFATPIHRFEDARLNLTVPCDFSVKFTDRSGEPSLIVSADGGELWCYGYGYRFKTNDGMNWIRESIVKDRAGSIGHNGMSVVDDTIYLITRDYQNNNDLLLFTSPLSDGLNFTYQGIVLDKGHDFGDGLSITNWGNSCMCKINGTYYLYIEGKDAQNRNFWDTYLVTCSDPLAPQQGGTIGDWQNSSVAPIISGSVLHPASTSLVSVGNPDFAKGPDNRPIRDANGKWFLYVHSTAFSYSYIHRISSYDLVHWSHDGRMFDNRNVPTSGENQSSNADQAIIEFKGRTYFFYTTDINTELEPHLAYMIDDRPIREIIGMRP